MKNRSIERALAHAHPNISLGVLFDKLTDLGLKESDPGKPLKRKQKEKAPSPKAKQTNQSPKAKQTNQSPAAKQTNQPNQFKEESLWARPKIIPWARPKIIPWAPPKIIPWAPPENPSKSVAPDRKIPQALKREIWRRDPGKCCNCGSQFAVEFDHLHPLALGGKSNPENLRLLCKSCNQRAAIQNLGMEQMENYI